MFYNFLIRSSHNHVSALGFSDRAVRNILHTNVIPSIKINLCSGTAWTRMGKSHSMLRQYFSKCSSHWLRKLIIRIMIQNMAQGQKVKWGKGRPSSALKLNMASHKDWPIHTAISLSSKQRSFTYHYFIIHHNDSESLWSLTSPHMRNSLSVVKGNETTN